MVNFEHYWFRDRTQIIWEKHLADLHINSYLEIGVNEGASMRWVLENLKPSVAVGVDVWRDPKNKQHEKFAKYKINCEQNLKPWLDDGTLTLVQSTSLDYFCSHISSQDTFDLIYIDGDHGGYEGMLDMLLAYQFLAKNTGEMPLQSIDSRGRPNPVTPTGGIMVIDDLHRRFHFGKPLVGIAAWMVDFLMLGKLHKLWQDGRQLAFIRVD